MLTFGVLVKTKHCNGAVHLTNEPPFYFPLEPVYRSLLFKEELNLNFNDIAYATLLGALSGGLFEGIAQVTASGKGGSAALETGKFSADTDGYLRDSGKDYFAGVEDVSELGKTYHELAKQNHPDVGGKNSVMAEISKQYGMKKAFYEAKKAVASAGPSLAQAEGGSAQALSALSTSGMDEGILSPYNNTLAMQGSRAYTGGKGTDILNSTAWGQGLSAGGFGDVLRTHPLGRTALEMVQAEPGAYVPQSVNLAAAILARIGQTADPAKTLNNVLNNVAMGPKGDGTVNGAATEAGLDSNILIDSYKNMRNNLDIAGQAHHLNQNAAFRDVIPKNDGLSVELEGNAFKDIGSPHYSAHENLENFWNNFRPHGDQFGSVPTISDYNSALYESLRAAGLTDIQAKSAVQSAIKQQSQYGLAGDSLVPRIPGRINFKK